MLQDGTHKWNPIVIFPEATTTNTAAVISFKLGAFRPLVPVQPVTIRYFYVHHQPNWLPGQDLFYQWRLLCQFVNFAEVTYLPAMAPHGGETAESFAERVRRVMATALNVPLTHHSYDDVVLLSKAERLATREQQSIGAIESGKIKEICGRYVELSSVIETMEKFVKADKNGNGTVDYDEFCNALELPRSSEVVKQMFHMLDVDEKGEIDFREYITNVALLSTKLTTEERLKAVFSAVDVNGDGEITMDEMKRALGRMNPDHWSDSNVKRVMKVIELDEDQALDYQGFKAHVLKHPLYFHMFFNAMSRRQGEQEGERVQEQEQEQEVHKDVKRESKKQK
mgnify:CR=1 FL=1